jgi:membrane fusion protein (multidrug efflux system)
MYDGHELEGVVESISPASAAAFSLLPPENTTGNWVKVTQRVPVRIALSPIDPKRPYRFGASCEVEINTSAKKTDA